MFEEIKGTMQRRASSVLKLFTITLTQTHTYMQTHKHTFIHIHTYITHIQQTQIHIHIYTYMHKPRCLLFVSTNIPSDKLFVHLIQADVRVSLPSEPLCLLHTSHVGLLMVSSILTPAFQNPTWAERKRRP